MDLNALKNAIENLSARLHILPENHLESALQRHFQFWPGMQKSTADPFLLPTLQVILDQIRSTVGAEMAALGVVQHRDNPFDPWVFSGVSPELKSQLGTAPRPVGTLGIAALEGKIVNTRNLLQHPAFRGLPKGHPEIRSLLAVPIFYREKSVGNIYLANKVDSNEFSKSDVEVVELLSKFAAFTLQEAYLLSLAEVSQHQLFSLFESAPTGVIFLDAVTKKLICNPLAAKIFNVSLAQIELKTIEEKLRTASGAKLSPEEQPFQLALSRRIAQEMEFMVFSSQTEISHINIKIIPIFSPGVGKILSGILAHVEDITASKQQRSLLAESEARLKRVVDGVNDGIFELDLVTDDAYISARWSQLLGFSEFELPRKGATYFERIHPDDMAIVNAAVQKLLTNNLPYDVDIRLKRKNGEYGWFNCRSRITRITEGKPTLVSGSISDITEKKRMEFDLKLKNQELEKAVQMRDEIAGIVSHEIKTPLTAITLTNELVKRSLLQNRKRDEILNLVDRIILSTQSLNRIITDIIDITKLEARLLVIEPKKSNLAILVADVTNLFDALASEKQIKLSGQVDPECQQVYCDPDRIKQVLSNLVSNAIKFTEVNGSINIMAKKVSDKVEVNVADTGKGLSSQQLTHIFDRFWQAKETSKLGSGLGLSVSKLLVEAHGEKIWVESKIGVGTTFHFTIASDELTPDLTPMTGLPITTMLLL